MSQKLFDLTGKVALVTGGSKGLGKAMARGFAEAGADILIASRHEDELRATVGKIELYTILRRQFWNCQFALSQEKITPPIAIPMRAAYDPFGSEYRTVVGFDWRANSLLSLIL